MSLKISAAKPAARLDVKLLLGSAAVALLAFGPQSASAQATAPAGGDQAAGNIEQVEVTATRVERAGYNAPTPTTVVGNDLLVTRAPPTLVDALVELPQFKQSATPGTAANGVAGTAGQSFVNLRGLGTNRTLLLVDGARQVPNSANGTVDINTLPSALVKSVDVVTGGASADWGSDAVAGVVNLVLDTNYSGLKGNIEGGITAAGDDQSGKASAVFGTNWGEGDKGHFLLSGEYYHADGLGRLQRALSAYPVSVVTNPSYVAGAACTGLNCYQRFIAPYVYQTNSYSGLISAGPLKGTTFDIAGNPTPYTYGAYLSSAAQVFTSPQNLPPAPTELLTVPVSRETVFSRFSYDVTSDVNVYFQASYGTSETGPFTSSSAGAIGSLTIYAGNPYLSPLLTAQMTASKVTSFTFQQFRAADWGPALVSTTNATSRFAWGADGKVFGDWSFHAYLEHGFNHNDYFIGNDSIPANLQLASDAVVNPATNQIVCRSTIANPTNGCQPANFFGIGHSTPQAIAYATGTASSVRLYTQDAASIHIAGNPFEIWDGPVSVAAGFDYRHEYANQTVDGLSAVSAFAIGNPQPLKGGYSVEEGFFETVVPLLRDVPLFKTFDFNGAVRVTNYSISGEATTWKAGLTDDVFDDLRLRATRSHDIRAPNIIELFTSTQQSTGTVTDPRNANNSYFIETLTSGNAALQPEVSDTTSAGVVYQPSWFEGFSASIDYYDISISKAISTLSVQNELNLCQAGQTDLCSLINRNSAGIITFITSPYLNLANFKTSGEDLEASYSSDLQDLLPFAPFLEGNLGLRVVANHVASYDTNSGVAILRQGGSLTIDQPGWSGDFTANYTNGAFHVLVDVPYIGGGAYDKQYSGFQFFQNHVSPIYYLNSTLEYTMAGNYTFYLAGSNLLDKAPPQIFNVPGGANYDYLGRAYRVGVRFKF